MQKKKFMIIRDQFMIIRAKKIKISIIWQKYIFLYGLPLL